MLRCKDVVLNQLMGTTTQTFVFGATASRSRSGKVGMDTKRPHGHECQLLLWFSDLDAEREWSLLLGAEQNTRVANRWGRPANFVSSANQRGPDFLEEEFFPESTTHPFQPEPGARNQLLWARIRCDSFAHMMLTQSLKLWARGNPKRRKARCYGTSLDTGEKRDVLSFVIGETALACRPRTCFEIRISQSAWLQLQREETCRS